MNADRVPHESVIRYPSLRFSFKSICCIATQTTDSAMGPEGQMEVYLPLNGTSLSLQRFLLNLDGLAGNHPSSSTVV